MPAPTPHRTPLRRISQGSLFRLSRSQAYNNSDAPHGLGFLEPVMSEFADETESLNANLEALQNLNQSLATFNESFASWLYVMNMNALTVDWPQAPSDPSFLLAERRAAEQDAHDVLQQVGRNQTRFAAASTPTSTQSGHIDIGGTGGGDGGGSVDKTNITEGNSTFTVPGALPTATSTASGDQSSRASAAGSSNSGATTKAAAKKKGASKPKMTAKERKERNVTLEKVISTMPLEFRGSDPILRRNMESVIEGLMDAPQQTCKITDLIRPDCNQARVNKCLISLVARKVVRKDNSTGQVLYHWNGM